MEDYARIRRMHEIDGMSVRDIHEKSGFSRDTIDKILDQGAPPGYRRKKPPVKPKLGPYLGVIDEILKADKKMPKKQRHDAKQICIRLQQEWGYTGGYTQVKDYVRESRTRLEKGVFVPLAFQPGTGQVDWGEATVWLDGEIQKGWIFVMTLPFSDARFIATFPRGTAEFFYEGHRLAFERFGGVPRVILYDNLKTAVTQILRGKGRKLNTTFQRFAEHYLFEPRFCNPAKGNEKGHVERGVRWCRTRFFVPRPDVSGGWEAFNHKLDERVRVTYNQRCRGHQETIADRLDEERTHLLPIPKNAPLLFHPTSTRVNSLCLVRFKTNDYSVPCRWAHHPVLLKPSVDMLHVFHQDRCIAQHRRCYKKEETMYEPWHYLPLIEKKPGSLDDAAPLKGLKLDPCFSALRGRLEAGQESSEGTRAYISVLRLLEQHSVQILTRAVQRALALSVYDAEAVKNLLLCPPDRVPGPLDLAGRPQLAVYHFAPPSLAGYGELMRGGVQ